MLINPIIRAAILQRLAARQALMAQLQQDRQPLLWNVGPLGGGIGGGPGIERFPGGLGGMPPGGMPPGGMPGGIGGFQGGMPGPGFRPGMGGFPGAGGFGGFGLKDDKTGKAKDGKTGKASEGASRPSSASSAMLARLHCFVKLKVAKGEKSVSREKPKSKKSSKDKSGSSKSGK
ncbi:uncharacterized protein LY89DRAFT_740474 [Mollisia scopiformis]|uniref:Uncharacterized protein n=1 Tax=Mollisia scopiformis TaxID=149040 RepID=A0A132BCG2_MOLSC|nr:uncharacterized protein LY89DRAFT_740474 [Mollisia scopiformis]KUJ10076.1 hypothetical protein LY89DRAFT_740474 [Mollisia scopiformis]